MNTEAKSLALAILTSAADKGATVGKTKLLKLLYLADIEYFRRHRSTLTGLNWIFYLYGPWADEFDLLISDLQTRAEIEVREWQAQSIDGSAMVVREKLDLSRVISETDEYFRVKHMVETWLDQSTPDLLDYVYFETAPMATAVKMMPLDFSVVPREAPQLYRRPKSAASVGEIARVRRRFGEIRERLKTENQPGPAGFLRPIIYDESYLKALETLNDPGAE